MMRFTLVCALVVALGLPAAPAAAQDQVNAPPGNSAVDQYLETVPAAGGNRRDAGGGEGGDGAVLTQGQKATLAARGVDGRTVQAFAESSGVAHKRTARTKAKRFLAASKRSGSAPVSGVLDRSLTGASGAGGGMGAAMPALLGAIALSGIAISLTRRRGIG